MIFKANLKSGLQLFKYRTHIEFNKYETYETWFEIRNLIA